MLFWGWASGLPWLKADVGLAMKTGTQAAKEAGNMVDLDSNPAKLKNR
jgi:high-affinity K+ transport system ATPase subunit B